MTAAKEGAFGRRDTDSIQGQGAPRGAGENQRGKIDLDWPGKAQRVRSPLETAEKIVNDDAAHRSLSADQVLMLKMVMPFADNVFRQLSSGAFQWFQHQGFWGSIDAERTIEWELMKKTEKLALIGTEVSEAIEAVRNGDFVNEEEELADILVRLFDYAGRYNIDLAYAYERKMVQNLSRPFKHNKKF